jgi:hypothetical protein
MCSLNHSSPNGNTPFKPYWNLHQKRASQCQAKLSSIVTRVIAKRCLESPSRCNPVHKQLGVEHMNVQRTVAKCNARGHPSIWVLESPDMGM